MARHKKMTQGLWNKNLFCILITSIILMLVIFCLFFLTPKQSYAYSIEPQIEEFTLKADETQNSILYFTNTTNQFKNFKIYSHRYNPKDEKIIEERDFVSLKQNFLHLEPNETGQIEYSVNIPTDILAGSYFSIIVVENILDKSVDKTSGISINYGIGSVIVIHVEDETNISQVFLEETQVLLKHKKPLNPLNTRIEYTIKNNSKFTFLISGNLGIFSKGEEPIYYKINPEELKLYPDAELTFEFEYKGNWQDLLKNKVAVAKIGTQFSNHLRETQIELNYLTQTVMLTTAFLTTIILTIIAIVIIKKQQAKTPQKK